MRRIVDPGDVDFDPAEPIASRLADVAVMAGADRHQPLADIGPGRKPKPQPVTRVLVHEAPIGSRQKSAGRLGHLEEIGDRPVAQTVLDTPGIGLQLRRETVQQRRLARTGFADDTQNLARPQRERHVPAGNPRAEALVDTDRVQQRRLVRLWSQIGEGQRGHSAAL